MADDKNNKNDDLRSNLAKALAEHSKWLGGVLAVGLLMGGLVYAASMAFGGDDTPPADEPAPVETPAVDTTTTGVTSKTMPSGPSIW